MTIRYRNGFDQNKDPKSGYIVNVLCTQHLAVKRPSHIGVNCIPRLEYMAE